MRRAVGLALMLAACAAPRPPAPAVVTRPEPGLVAEPARPAHARELPPGLAVDPARLEVPPLEVRLREPQVVALPNGLSLYLLEDHTAPLVLLRVLLPVGTADEPADTLGLASLAAALATEGGAGSTSAAALDEVLELHGADLSGGAAEEYSTVTLSARAQDLERLFPLFADVVQRPRYEPERVEVGVGRLLEAIRRREDRPDTVATRALAKAVFGPGSPLAREAVEATARRINPDELKRFHASTWSARGARLIITGDFDAGQVRALVTKHFAGWKGGKAPARTWERAAPLVRRVILVPRKVAQAKVRLGAAGFARRSPDEYPARLTNTALGAFGVGRLYREIRDEKGLAYSAWSLVSPGPTTGLFTAGFDTRPRQVGEALDAALRILAGAGGPAPLSGAELRVAGDMALNAFVFRFDAASRIAFERALFDLFGYPKDYLATWREKIGAVTPEQSAQLARRFAEGLQIVVVGPPEELGDLSRFGPVITISDVEQFR